MQNIFVCHSNFFTTTTINLNQLKMKRKLKLNNKNKNESRVARIVKMKNQDLAKLSSWGC